METGGSRTLSSLCPVFFPVYTSFLIFPPLVLLRDLLRTVSHGHSIKTTSSSLRQRAFWEFRASTEFFSSDKWLCSFLYYPDLEQFFVFPFLPWIETKSAYSRRSQYSISCWSFYIEQKSWLCFPIKCVEVSWSSFSFQAHHLSEKACESMCKYLFSITQ